MKKFKLIALALLASTFGLASCDLPEFVQVPVDWANSNIVDPIKDLIPGAKDKEEEEDPDEETKDEVVSVSISGLPSSVSDESAAFKLTATVEVKGNASKGVSWSSSNEAVATVDSEGLVTPKGAGEVTITATSTADSSKSGSVTFSVSCVAKVISVSVYGAPASVTDETVPFKLSASVEVKGDASKEVIWSSSNENVAKVDASGLVTPVGAGDVTITATSKVDSSKYGFVTFSVSVVPGVSSVKISGLPEDISDETAPFQLSAAVQAKGGASEEVIWSSSDSSIASVSESGLVTLTGKAGEVSITATSKVDSSKSDSVSFEVYVLPAILSVEIEGAPESPVILYKDEVKLTAEVESKGTIASSVTWSSSDESIATVKDGVVTFLKAGEVTITATANKDSSKSDSVTISAIYKGLHPELLDEGYEFSDEWPEELLEAFAGVDAPVLECVHGFYYKENAPVIDETTGEQSKAGTFRVVADYVDISLMDDFEAAAEEMGYYEFVDTYLASYGYYTFCFLDPSLKAEIDFDFYSRSEAGDTFSFIVYHVEDIWESKEKTADEGWSDEVKAEMTKFGEELPFIALGEDYTAEYDADYEQLAIYDYCPDYTLLDSYGDILLGDGFSVSGSEEEGYVYKKALESGDTLNVQFGFTTSGNTIVAYYTHGFPTAKLEEIFSEKGLTDRVPAYNGELSNCNLIEDDNSFQLQMIVAEGSESEVIAQYQGVLLTAGYTEAGADQYGDMHYASPNGELDVCVWNGVDINRSGYVFVDIEISNPEPAEFPTAKIFEDLTAAGVTDTIPAYSGEATYYSYFSKDGTRQLAFKPSVSESEAVATYQADLLAAGYTEAGADKYGDMHYTSPNGELDVCAWKGSDIDYSGYVFVDIKINAIGETVTSISFEDEIAAFLEEGIELSIPDYSGEGFIVEYLEAQQAYVFHGSNKDEMDAYAAELEKAGWVLSTDSFGDYSGTFGDSLASVYLGDYTSEAQNGIVLQFSMAAPAVESVNFDDIVAMFAEADIDVEIPDFDGEALSAESQDGMFTIYGATKEELGAFYDALSEAGWNLSELSEKWYDFEGTFGDSLAAISVEDWIGTSDDCIIITFSLKEPPTADFPRAALNEWLSNNGFDLEISEEVAGQLTALLDEGELFTLEDAPYFGMPGLNVVLDGYHAEEAEAILAPVLEAAGLAYDEEDECYYGPQYSCAVSFAEDEGQTSIWFLSFAY